LPAVVAALVSSCGAAPITLVDSTGKLAAARDLISCGARCGERAAVVAAVGSKGTRKNALLNAAFGTEFQTKGGLKAGSAAAIAASSPGTVVVNCDGVTSDSEAKLAALSVSMRDQRSAAHIHLLRLCDTSLYLILQYSTLVCPADCCERCCRPEYIQQRCWTQRSCQHAGSQVYLHTEASKLRSSS
jgi:hypothetical protein